MNRNRLIAMVLAVLASLGLTFTVATPALGAVTSASASASSVASSAQAPDYEFDTTVPRDYSSHYKDCMTVWAGTACVQPYGDILWIRDRQKDGFALTLTWRDLDGDRRGQCYGGGVDNGWLACNKNFPEGHEIRWWVVYYDSNGALQQTGYRDTTV